MKLQRNLQLNYKEVAKIDKIKFIEEITNISPMDEIQNIMNSIDNTSQCEYTGRSKNLLMFIENLSELSKELTKYLRGKGEISKILEELADVQIDIYYIQTILALSQESLDKAITVKMKRVEKTLIDNGYWV